MSGVYVSALELFSIGIGPSSSHTVGPMRAAAAFREAVAALPRRAEVRRVRVRLHGSLGATGIGHGTPGAVIAGLGGADPTTCDPAEAPRLWEKLGDEGALDIDGVRLDRADVVFEPFARDYAHPNALTLEAHGDDGEELLAQTYLSVGGGFIRRADEEPGTAVPRATRAYGTMAELLELCGERGIAEIAWEDEIAIHGSEDAVQRGLDAIWAAMSACIDRGIATDGTLPGGLGVSRRAAAAWRHLSARPREQVTSGERVAVYAMAVNEENAAGGRVVTAPTNGAAGVIPAVLRYAVDEGADADAVRRFLLTASAIGSLIKANASISGAEAGCQGEVGSACAMAAAAVCATWGGTPAQIENAAEIAMEHHLGLTCDPVGGLVQVPCIERNAVAASTALTAARIALLGDGTHVVSLDVAIETMRQTGEDMSSRYKETATGGLAVNVPYC
ncbi:L-serine ammonia-lyase [Microbacterium sp. gxy059]|uniref:L-serine ammonia-lyase n=1 Tax=Microbacterium sp. gxy059 TaxID=2957199 RepID=UPI003D994F41